MHRQITEMPEWLAEPFTRGQAWVDLLLLANHETGFIRKRGILIAVDRGQVGHSEETLALRWQWSRGKVRRFIAELERLSRVSRKISEKTIPKKTSVSSLIFIVNYDKYQVNSTEDDTENGRKTVQEQRMKRMKRNIYTPNYEVFWKEYPKKSSSKKAAFDQWNKLNGNRPTIETIIEAIKKQIEWRRNAPPGEFRPEWKDAERWLKNRMWEAELSEIKADPKSNLDCACPRCGAQVPQQDKTAHGCIYCDDKTMEARA